MKLRQSNIERLDNRTFDVLVIGGGINGAVCATALSGKGAKVALIERADFASQTSQESSNLVWGGIKYMESYEFFLVHKLCRSRNRLIRTYPSIVKETRFLATLGRSKVKPRFLVWLGALLYWFIGGFFTRRPFILSKKAIKNMEPVVAVEDSQGGVEYSDACLLDNDARFVWRLVRDALDHGAVVANYMSAESFSREGNLWAVTARDAVGERTITIRAKVLLNAGGPWVDPLNERVGVKTTHRHLFSKGIHLIVRRLTKENRVLAFFASDGRLFFVLPLGTRSCIGTTDTRVEELPALITPEDRRFVLDNVNARLDLEQPLTESDIIAERCGVRPLVVEVSEGEHKHGDWTSLSRKHAIEVDGERRFISIFGGKLTDCLNIGEEVCAQMANLGVSLPYTRDRWYGEPTSGARRRFFHQAALLGLDEMTAPESSEVLSTRLWRRYGHGAFSLLEDIRQDPKMGEVLINGTEYMRAEINYAARCEMVTKLEDFLRRRSKISQVERTEVIRNAPGLLEACRILFGEQAEARLEEYFAEVQPTGAELAATETSPEVTRQDQT